MGSVEPRLVAVAGPLQGSVHLLESDEVTIGRDITNTLPVSDSKASRRHSVLTRSGGSYEIADCESTNGTFVNGLPANRRLLQHGDQIEIGASRFLFLLRDADSGDSIGLAPLAMNDVRMGSTVRLSPAEALYLRPDRVRAALPATADGRIALDLQVLLTASRQIAQARSVVELGSKLVDLALEAVPAERGTLLLPGEGDGFSAAAQKDRVSGRTQPVPISRTVLAQVRRDGEAVFSNDLQETASLRGATSLVASPVRALAALPVGVPGSLFGVLYLDSGSSDFRVSEADLQLLMGLANIAAGAFENVRHLERLESERERLSADGAGSEMVGESEAIRRVHQFVARVARADATVLILGESGTGKELVARALHRASPRNAAPFVAIHCAALAETILESELFGHERGSFTGALAQKKGKIEVADGGTVFLDEIGELSPAAQVKLLRVLQEREFERVGGTRPIHVDIRVIAATNKNLEKEAASGGFREDLYYRLSVVSLTMPALREHREDIPLLASYFAARFGQKLRNRIPGISPEARAVLLRYDWPGNVRELANAIERAVVLGSGDVIVPEDLPEALLEAGGAPGSPDLRLASYHDTVNAAKRQAILEATREAHGNYTEAARLLGVHPNYLHRLVRNLNLKDEIQKER